MNAVSTYYCPCGNVKLVIGARAQAEEGDKTGSLVGADVAAVQVVIEALMAYRQEEKARIATCTNCMLDVYVVTEGEGAVVGREKFAVSKSLVTTVSGVSPAFGIKIDVSGKRLANVNAVLLRVLERYKQQVLEEARAKLDRAELEGRVLAAKILERPKKEDGSVARVGSVPVASQSKVIVVQKKKTVAFSDMPAVEASEHKVVSKSLPAKSALLDSLFGLDEELEDGNNNDRSSSEVAFPKKLQEDDEDDKLDTSDPFGDTLLPGSRHILFGSTDEANNTPSKITMAHSLPVAVPLFRHRSPAAPPTPMSEDSDVNDAVAEPLHVVAANTFKEELRQEWIGKSKLGADDQEFLLAAKSSAPSRSARAKTLL